MTPSTSTSVKPGQILTVRHSRNSHIGGFIRWAIVPRGQESKAAFDQNVFHFTCRASGSTCVPPGQNSIYSGDNGAAENSILCGDTIPLPNYLKVGDYVLQCTWMSAGSSYGKISWANEQYRSSSGMSSKTSKLNNTKAAKAKSTGTKTEWQYCSTNSECANNCCSKKLVDDGMLRCTPGGC